jgi:hypothetical protein
MWRVARPVLSRLQHRRCNTGGATQEVPAVNYHSTAKCCGNEEGSYVRLIDSGITQLQAQGHFEVA